MVLKWVFCFPRACILCKSIYFYSDIWLCSFCLQILQAEFLSNPFFSRKEKSFLHFRLINWSSENHFFVSPVVYSLKNKKTSSLLKFLADHFIHQMLQSQFIDLQKDFIVIPSPSYKNQEDHAHVLAKEVSKKLGCPLIHALKKTDPTPQKRKSLSERAQVKIYLKKEFQSQKKIWAKSKNILFVDDVLTTGYTSLLAYRALGFSKGFFACTLFWKVRRESL